MRVDRIFEGGTLLTMDPARPRARAVAVLGSRIVAVGDGDELRRHLDAERVVSLQARTVVPGFHDTRTTPCRPSAWGSPTSPCPRRRSGA